MAERHASKHIDHEPLAHHDRHHGVVHEDVYFDRDGEGQEHEHVKYSDERTHAIAQHKDYYTTDKRVSDPVAITKKAPSVPHY